MCVDEWCRECVFICVLQRNKVGAGKKGKGNLEEDGKEDGSSDEDKGREHSRRRRKEGAVRAVGDTVAQHHHVPHIRAVALNALKTVGMLQDARAGLVEILWRRLVRVIVFNVRLAHRGTGPARPRAHLVVARQTFPACESCAFHQTEKKSQP